MDLRNRRDRRAAMCLWPGLPQLWLRGSTWALGVAVGFGILLNLVIVASFGWTEWVGPRLRTAGWIVLAVTWVASAVTSWHRKAYAGDNRSRGDDRRNHRGSVASQTERSAKDDTQRPEDDALFRQARDDYLRGNWYEAEETLVRLLHRNANDVDARLLLATLMRHTQRFDNACEQLKQLQRLEAAAKWQLEIRREWEYLARDQQADEVPKDETDGSDPPQSQQATQSPIDRDPVAENPVAENPVAGDPVAENPVAGNPVVGNPVVGNPVAGNQESSSPTDVPHAA